MGVKAKGGKKNRKYGRNASYCKRRAADGREERNKLRRMRRHLRRHPGDTANKSRFHAARGTDDYLNSRQGAA